jgi:hypothetical protein
MESNSGGRPRAVTTAGSFIGAVPEDPLAIQMDGTAQLSIINSLLSSTNKAKFLVHNMRPSHLPFSFSLHRFRSFIYYIN